MLFPEGKCIGGWLYTWKRELWAWQSGPVPAGSCTWWCAFERPGKQSCTPSYILSAHGPWLECTSESRPFTHGGGSSGWEGELWSVVVQLGPVAEARHGSNSRPVFLKVSLDVSLQVTKLVLIFTAIRAVMYSQDQPSTSVNTQNEIVITQRIWRGSESPISFPSVPLWDF